MARAPVSAWIKQCEAVHYVADGRGVDCMPQMFPSLAHLRADILSQACATHCGVARRFRMNATVQQQVFEIIAEQGRIELDTITTESTLSDLGIASLEAIEIIFEIEEHFDITLPDQDTDFDTGSVQGLLDAVNAAIAAKPADDSTPAPPASSDS